MTELKKILIAVLGTLAGLYLLSVFILFNLPYHALISRLDQTLQSQYGTSLTVGQVLYRYPFRMHMSDVRVVHERETFVMSLDDLYLRLKLVSFSNQKSFELSGSGIGFRSQWVDISGASFNLIARIRLFPLLRGMEGNHVTSLQFVTGGADVDRVLISGFELNGLRLKQVQLFLDGDDEGFSVERGILSADVVKSELEGRIGFQNLDLVLRVILTEDFYRKYSDLRSIVDSFFRDGTLQIKLQGSIDRPRASVIR